MTSIDPSPSTTHWCERLPPVHSTTKLHVHTSQITEIATQSAVHPLQRFTRTWSLHASDSNALKKLRVTAPGLTITRVNPIVCDGGTMIARVRVTSDESQHIDRVQITTKKRNELRVEFTNATHDERDAEQGTLVVEIDLAHAQQIEQVVAMGGGAVSVLNGVLVNSIHQCLLLAALHESKLWVNERTSGHLQLKELFVGSAGDGDVYLQANELTVRETLACGVSGDGRICIVAPRTWAATSQVTVVGNRGSVQVKATSGFATEALTGLVKGSGECTLQSSPAVEFGRHTTSTTQHLTVEGTGSLDVAGIPADCCRVKTRGAGRVVVQPRQKLRLDGSADAVVECVGLLPADVQASRKAKTVSSVGYHHRLAQQRIRDATNPTAAIPEAQTVEAAFESPHDLYVLQAGFRATFLQAFLDAL